MEYTEITEELKKIIQPALEQEGFALVELSLGRSRSGSTLAVFADRIGGGIDLGDCAMLNRKIGDLLDAANIMPEGCFLEVSSPGIDRPLKTKNDFLRCMGRRVKFFLREAINGKIEWEAKVLEADDDKVVAEIKKGNFQIPLSNIAKAKQVI